MSLSGNSEPPETAGTTTWPPFYQSDTLSRIDLGPPAKKESKREPRTFVPAVALKSEMRDKIKRYRRRLSWLPGLIDHLLFPYPFPFEDEVTTCLESESHPYATTDLIIQTDQCGKQMTKLVPVYRVRSDCFRTELIVKRSISRDYRRNEAMSLAFIREFTTIPVPKVLQVSEAGHDNTFPELSYLAMEFIPGRTLAECWDSLGLFTKLKLIWTLRNYLIQLRDLRRTTPGPLDRTIMFEGPHFNLGVGPFDTHEDMIRWLNRRIEIGKKGFGTKYYGSPFTTSDQLVFCHQDICLRNLLLGDDGVLYMLDWEWAGFYPEWMEYAGMMRYPEQPWLFRKLIPFICGSRHIQNMKRYEGAFWAIVVGYLIE